MQRILWLLTTFALLGLSSVHTQPAGFATSPHVWNALTRVVRSDGTTVAGLFTGIVGDSVSLVVGGTPTKISWHQMRWLKIERRAEHREAPLAGLLLGAYAGNLAFLTGREQPFAFYAENSNSPLVEILENVGFAAVGAGIGYLVGSSAEGEESFDFAESEEVSQKEWERLCAFVSETDPRRVVHLSFQGAWVDTYLPNSVRSFYYGSGSVAEASNFNIMRKIQLTVTFTQLIDGGFALMWLGQPSSTWYSSNSSGWVGMTGKGYYVLGVLKPLHEVAPRNVQLDIGVGVGVSNVNYISHSYSYTYPDYSQTDVNIQRTMFSALVYAEAKLFLFSYLSLGITGDYVYVPEDVPAIQEIKSESRAMGTASIGFALGLHF